MRTTLLLQRVALSSSMHDIQKCCMSHWWPILESTGVAVPRTVLVNTEGQKLRGILDGDSDSETVNAFNDLIERLTGVSEDFDTPFFLRTGQGSGKHEWETTCCVEDRDLLPQHVGSLMEWSELVSIMGLPYSVWAIREMLPVSPLFKVFRGMPFVTEARCFFGAGKTHVNNYWPIDAIRNPDDTEWEEKYLDSDRVVDLYTDKLVELTEQVKPSFEGNWSLDWLLTDDGWVAIDMAVAHMSYGCPEEYEEDR